MTYFALDSYYYKREHWTSLSADAREHKPLKIIGKTNVVYLVGVILSVAFIHPGYIPQMADASSPLWIRYMREIVLLLLMLMSLFTTKHHVRYELNKYSWAPINEVAVLFFGIFVTMTPA